ncbi:MAG: aminotransferase class III-fold pyridoxal phosphate-dependent enzyme [Gammaproteobacteria bacterium]|jgi:4-aminobutyrate---pyruvate transaminase|nr:aminotransferase class III-fold pyridoxal phosphate-dependent enzyme [Gammaproteobacteria bacterium]MBT6482773.1 aminotransferase class III-fold pyridoxal phosphate-dependent enzyme [Gammaproteobacteria bacterium]
MSSVIYPVTNLKSVEQINIVRGKGVYVYDDTGNQYLEGLSGLWCSALGYGNEELIEAISSQLHTLSYSHLFGGRTHPVVMELADRLAAMVPVKDARVFFSNSGSEANDSQIKMLRYYANAIGKPEKKKIIALDRGYHGVTVAAAALTGLPVMHSHFDLPVDALGILRADCPHYFRGRVDAETEEEFVERLLKNLQQLIHDEGADTIVAFVAEPLMGAGGVIVSPQGYLPQVQSLLNENDIFLWADEVICGFGRTGNDFGSTTMGIQPDIMSLAKQLSSAYVPISAAVIPGAMYEAMIDQSAEVGVFGHGYTYTGHPVACAAALKALEIYERDGLFARAAKQGAYLQSRLQEFASHELVGEVRGKGLIGAVELVADKGTGQAFADGKVGAFAQRACQDEGLLLRAVAGNSVAFCPPLIIKEAQIDEMIEKFARALDASLEFARQEKLIR